MPRTETTNHVPNAELQKKINRYKADPAYMKHTAAPEDQAHEFWTLVVTLMDEN